MAAGENTNILQSEKEVLLLSLWGTMLQSRRSICWMLLDPAAFLPHDLWSLCPVTPSYLHPKQTKGVIAQSIAQLPSNSRKMSSQGIHILGMSTQVAQKWAGDSVAGALPSCTSALTQQGFDFFAWQHLSYAKPFPRLSNAQFNPTDISLFDCCLILLIKALGKFYTC